MPDPEHTRTHAHTHTHTLSASKTSVSLSQPDWILAEVAVLSKMSSIRVKLIARLALEHLRGASTAFDYEVSISCCFFLVERVNFVTYTVLVACLFTHDMRGDDQPFVTYLIRHVLLLLALVLIDCSPNATSLARFFAETGSTDDVGAHSLRAGGAQGYRCHAALLLQQVGGVFGLKMCASVFRVVCLPCCAFATTSR
jgi:hypothetical protein